MTPEQEHEIRERDKNTMKGPWAWTEDLYTYKTGQSQVRVHPHQLQALYPHKDQYRDAHDDNVFCIGWPSKKGEIIIYGLDDNIKDFIAHAREDIPLLLAEIDRLRMENNTK